MRFLMIGLIVLGVTLVAIGLKGRLSEYEDTGRSHIRFKAHNLPNFERVLCIGIGVGLIYFGARSLKRK